jgi:hypothetical protein
MDQSSGTKPSRAEIAEQILDRVASDSEFRQQLLSNPAETLKEWGYDTSDDVSGYGMPGAGTTAMGCGVPPGLSAGSKPPSIGTTAIGCGGGGGGGVPGSDPYEGSPTMTSSPSTSSTPPGSSSSEKDSTSH